MRPYGVNPRWDQNCCPGHSRYPLDSYKNNRSKAAQTRDSAVAHRAERRRARAEARAEARGAREE